MPGTTRDDGALGTRLAPAGALRASINLGNAVLTNGSFDNPDGITVDLSHELGRRLGVPVELVLWDAARKSVDAVRDGMADVCFLAVDPVRAEELAFSAPYVVIEGTVCGPSMVRSCRSRNRVAISRQHAPETIAWMRDVVDELLATGWVREALSRHCHDPALAASRPG